MLCVQIKTGVVNCVLHIIVLQLAINTWGKAFFNLDVYPEWAPPRKSLMTTNATLDGNSTIPLFFFNATSPTTTLF